MNALVNTENLLMWVRDGRVVTVDVRKEGQGYVAEWWISGNFEGDLHVMGVMKFPIYGDSEEDARQRAGFLLDDVLYIGQVFYGGDGLVGSITPDRSKRAGLAVMHLAGHWKEVSTGLSVAERTAKEYKFLRQFGVSNVAQIIRDVEGVESIRTVHERIFLAKQKKLI
jgi:hypothetical protein